VLFEAVDAPRSDNDAVMARAGQGVPGPLPRRDSLKPQVVFRSDWCTAHHLAAGTTPHRVRMERHAHTLLVFDGGSYSEGERRIDGTRLGAAGALDAGIDVVPARSRLVAWSGVSSNIGVTLITLDSERMARIVGEPAASAAVHGLRPDINLRNELLSPLVARVRRWSMLDDAESDTMQRETILMLIMQEIMRMQRLQSGGTAVNRGGLSLRAQRLVREFVAAHLDTRIELQTLADLVGMSRFHFSRAFKVSFGLPPHKYLMAERVRVAAKKIGGTDHSITDIALQVGFSCSSELTRLFKQAMGCTPRTYRAARRSGTVRQEARVTR